jgi:hypothetical protein
MKIRQRAVEMPYVLSQIRSDSQRPPRARAVGMSISTFPQALLQVNLLQEKNFRRYWQAEANK